MHNAQFYICVLVMLYLVTATTSIATSVKKNELITSFHNHRARVGLIALTKMAFRFLSLYAEVIQAATNSLVLNSESSDCSDHGVDGSEVIVTVVT